MTLVKVTKTGESHEFESQSHRTCNWMGTEWLEVPDNLVQALYDCSGYCDLVIKNGTITGITPIGSPEVNTVTDVPTLEERIAALERLQLESLGVIPNV